MVPVGVGPEPVTDTVTPRVWPVSMLVGEGVTDDGRRQRDGYRQVIDPVPVFPA